MKITFELNGEPISADVRPSRALRDVLREEFDKTGVKVGCHSGRCGVCTIHFDGRAAKACLIPAGKADGATVQTIEGLADGDHHPLQSAFEDHFALQCGYCTPGVLMTAAAYLEDGGDADRDAIKSALKGNLCRCTGYVRIIDAIEAVAQRWNEPEGVRE